MGSNQDVRELAAYLESDDVSVVRQVKQVIQENLYSSKEPWFLNSLFDLYLIRKSDQLLDVLLGINEFKANQLFEKMNESLKQGLHTEVCTLLAAIARKQPSWLHKVIGTQFFINFLKFLKCEDDVVLVMSGCYIISSLLPCVPSLIAPYLGEIMVIFYKFASLLVNHSVAVPDILLLHLQIGVYTLFQRLYSMYPNTFVAFMKENFAGHKQGDIVVNQVIKPMFSFVKFHPGLCTDTVKTETDNSKWKLFQPHDIVTECQKLSLDPLDTVREATYSVFPRLSLDGEGVGSFTTSSSILGSSLINVTPVDEAGITKPPIELDLVQHDSEASKIEDTSKIEDKSFLSSQPLSTGFSPSELCGLSTPPHSRPQSPLESMEDSAVVIDHSARGAARVSLTESNREAASPVLHEQSSGGRYDVKTGSEERSHIPLPPQSYNVETSPVFQRFNQSSKLNSNESVVRRHGRLLNLALTASDPMEKFENLDRAYHSVPATPTQALTRSRPYGDWFYSQSSQQGCNSSGEPKRVSPLPIVECKKRELELEDPKDNKLNFTSRGTTFDHGLDPGFTPIRSSPIPSRDESPHDDHYQNVPVALINTIQELQRGFIPRRQLEVRRSSIEISDPVSDSQRLKNRTPMEILDEFIECGANVYSMELSRIPLTSQLDTDWTYFGGNSPADESSILKTQLKLMHLQLQYERHKCELQVLRNRRLVGKVRKAQDAADEVSILRTRIQLLESEQNGDRLSLRKREEENRNMKSMIKTSEDYYMSTIQIMREDRGKLKYEIAELSDKNACLVKKVSDLEEEIRRNSITKLENDSEIKSLKAQLVTNTDVKLKAENLAKELLTQQDRYEQLRDKMKTFSIYCNQSEEKKLIIQSFKQENAALKDEKQTLVSTLDAAKIRIQDLEVALGKKEMAVREHKNHVESLRHQHSCEVKALESKYKSLNRACQALEAYVMHLYAKLEESGCQINQSHGHAVSGHEVSGHEERTQAKDNHSTSSYARHKHHRGVATRHSNPDPERRSTQGTDSVVDSVLDSGIVE